jgi:hypothetical protein
MKSRKTGWKEYVTRMDRFVEKTGDKRPLANMEVK